MDPRHPELVLDRLKVLIEQFSRIDKDIKGATVASKLGQLEREGGLVVQEICLTAPRLHEMMMQTSRNRRSQLSRGITYIPEERLDNGFVKATIGIKKEEKEEKEEKPKRKRKTTRKKKEEK